MRVAVIDHGTVCGVLLPQATICQTGGGSTFASSLPSLSVVGPTRAYVYCSSAMTTSANPLPNLAPPLASLSLASVSLASLASLASGMQHCRGCSVAEYAALPAGHPRPAASCSSGALHPASDLRLYGANTTALEVLESWKSCRRPAGFIFTTPVAPLDVFILIEKQIKNPSFVFE